MPYNHIGHGFSADITRTFRNMLNQNQLKSTWRQNDRMVVAQMIVPLYVPSHHVRPHAHTTFLHFTFLRGLSGVAPLYPSVRPTNASEFAKNDNSRGPGDLRARCERSGPLKNFKKVRNS